MGKDKLSKNYLKLIVIILFFINFQSYWAQSSDTKNISSSQMQSLYMINVTIGGDFPLTGTYPASGTERVDQFITRIANQYKAEIFTTTPDEELLGLLKSNSENFAKRNITLKRFSGNEIDIDLLKFRGTGDFNFNPYLQNDDILIFPTLDLERSFIDISGAINKESKFQFVEGDKLSDAILFAHGINKAYSNIDSAQISRLSYDGKTEEIVNVSLADNPLLKRGDRIRILSDETKKRSYSVLVLGEVKRPGKVYITENNTTLKEVIKKAGGFTDNASLKFSNLIRDNSSYESLDNISIEKYERAGLSKINEQYQSKMIYELELVRMYRNANLELRDTLYFGIDNKLRILSGYADLDFRNLQNDSSYESSYIVNDKDVIIVPIQKDEIYVWGGVAKTGFYPYGSNLSVWDYINNAGGYADIAYGEDEVFLIKGKSYNWLRAVDHDNLKVEAGDYIYVKKEQPTQEFWYYLSRVGAVASILGSLATIILIFK